MNPIKGQVSFEADGEPFVLQYTINSLCILEDHLKMTVGQIGEKMGQEMSITFLRSVFWVGLLAHHPDIGEVDAGELIPVVGPDKVGEMIGEAFVKAFPAPTKGAANGAARPRKAPAGTGKISSAGGLN